jgi:hypothetical protein
MKRILVTFFIVFSACNSPLSTTKESSDTTVAVKQSPQFTQEDQVSPTELIDKNQILGAWTDGSTENATFDISKDSIFYLDEMTSFPYTLKGDSLTIVYPDMSFEGSARLIGDTLVLSDPELGTTKYTRFKN